MYQCERYIGTVQWFKNILEKFCGLRNPQLIKLGFLDIPKMSTKCKNSTIMLISSFIVSMRQARKSHMDNNATKNYIKSKLLREKLQLTYMFGDRLEDVLPTEVCDMKWSDL